MFNRILYENPVSHGKVEKLTTPDIKEAITRAGSVPAP
jgi:hypothetical protein